MNKLTQTVSPHRRFSKVGLTLVTFIVGLVILVAPFDTASAGGGCSSTDGICNTAIELYAA